ncbi:MAG TPA: hypothetical protein VGH44_03105 [Candidatus Saccharimonadia bacterium]
MVPSIPLTGLTTSLGCLISFAAWLYLGQRIRQANTAPNQSLAYLRSFFLFMTLFTAGMSLPIYWLHVGPSAFSTAMAWGYVVGHIFLYLACIRISLMVISIVPQLAGKGRILTVVWILFTIAITIVNAKTMIWGVQPVYNTTLDITEFRAAPIVGVGIVVACLLSLLPAAILFAINAAKGSLAKRTKSVLLAAGFLIIIIGGPMHDLARSAGAYAAADAIYIVGTLLIAVGIAYRVQSALVAPERTPAKLASSNTV